MKNKRVITNNELNFIESLNEASRKNIFRGLAIPSDYGYNPDVVYFTIDGQTVSGTPCECEKFVKLFKQLETLMKSDDKAYWVLYDEAMPWQEYHEIFWCIPTSEIDFYYDGSWHIASGVGVVSGITLNVTELILDS